VQALKREGGSSVVHAFGHLFVKQFAVALEHLRDRTGHRTVEEDHQVGDRILRQQLVDVIEQILRPLQCETGHDDVAAGGFRGVDNLGDVRLDVSVLAMDAIAIGGFHENVIGLVHLRRIAHDGLIRAAHVAAEQHAAGFAVLLDAHVDDRRAQNVAGLAERRGDAVGDLYGRLVPHPLEQGPGRLGVGGCIERDDGIRTFASLPLVSFALIFGVFFLEPGGVQHDDAGDLGGRGGAVHRSGESLLDQLGQQAAMVQMGVGQEHRVDAGGREVERLPVAPLELSFLIQAAVDQQPRSVDFEHVA